jgi:hypothetical protein
LVLAALAPVPEPPPQAVTAQIRYSVPLLRLAAAGAAEIMVLLGQTAVLGVAARVNLAPLEAPQLMAVLVATAR